MIITWRLTLVSQALKNIPHHMNLSSLTWVHSKLFDALSAETLVALSVSSLFGNLFPLWRKRHQVIAPSGPSRQQKNQPNSPKELIWRVRSSPGCTAPVSRAPHCHPHIVHSPGSKTHGLHQATVSVPGELRPTVRLSSHFWENETWNPFQHQASWKLPSIRQWDGYGWI